MHTCPVENMVVRSTGGFLEVIVSCLQCETTQIVGAVKGQRIYQS